MNIEDFNILYDFNRDELIERENQITCFLYNLIDINNEDDLMGLKIVADEKYVHIKTDYNSFVKRGLSKINLLGAIEIRKLIKTKESIIKQPVYHLKLENIDLSYMKQFKVTLLLKVNYVHLNYLEE